jgi:hypothetical protein
VLYKLFVSDDDFDLAINVPIKFHDVPVIGVLVQPNSVDRKKPLTISDCFSQEKCAFVEEVMNKNIVNLFASATGVRAVNIGFRTTRGFKHYHGDQFPCIRVLLSDAYQFADHKDTLVASFKSNYDVFVEYVPVAKSCGVE